MTPSEVFPTDFKEFDCFMRLNQHILSQNYPKNILTYLHLGRLLSSM